MQAVRLLIGAAALLLQALAPISAQEAPTGYRLGPGDKLRISVHEWRTARNELFEWSAPKGEFTIDTEGYLSLPVLGEVKAKSLKVAELAAHISDSLQARLGFVQRPETAVEVVAFRPFYILGFVNKPGDYPYRPGMNVLNAVSIAGGFYRAGDASMARFERESITAKGELRVFEAEQLSLMARRARLLAELEQAETISFPSELTRQRGEAATRMMREEQLLFQSRRQGLRSQIDALDQAKALLQREIASLRTKDATQDRQMKLAKRDLDNVNSLVAKGLSIAARQLALEQTLAQIESARQDLNLSIIRAEQEMNRAERQALDLRNQRQNEILAELRLAQTRMRELQEKSQTALQLAYESEVLAPKLAEQRADDELGQPGFTIIRAGAEGSVEITAEQTDVLQPGDILTVERPGKGKKPATGSTPGAGAALETPSGPALLRFSLPGTPQPSLSR